VAVRPYSAPTRDPHPTPPFATLGLAQGRLWLRLKYGSARDDAADVSSNPPSRNISYLRARYAKTPSAPALGEYAPLSRYNPLLDRSCCDKRNQSSVLRFVTPSSDTTKTTARRLTAAANASFVPIGIATVILSPLLPTLSARWSLNYSQAGALFTAQFLASTIAVSLSGILSARWGFRFAINTGLFVIAASIALLLTGSRVLGIACIAGYGAGSGIAVPAGNLMVAEVNPTRRSSALNVLNFCWSAGAVACPFLVAAADKVHRVPLLLACIAGFSVLVVIWIASLPFPFANAAATEIPEHKAIDWNHRALPALVALFFLYIGTENAFGGWVAAYATSLHNMALAVAVITPSFFYAALTFGRWLAPLFLRKVDQVHFARTGLLLACAGIAGMTRSHALMGVSLSAIAAGLGLSGVYPITISLLSREFGAAASRVGSLAFTMSNLGGACLPWLVGRTSSQFGTLRVGLIIPLFGSALMFALYLRDWRPIAAES
jgi:MFS transporter, FHS family, glucose/mannose:H+ symporter